MSDTQGLAPSCCPVSVSGPMLLTHHDVKDHWFPNRWMPGAHRASDLTAAWPGVVEAGLAFLQKWCPGTHIALCNVRSTRSTRSTLVDHGIDGVLIRAVAVVAVPGLFGGLSGPGGFGGAPTLGLFGGPLASGVAAPEILGVFAASPSRNGEVPDVMAAASDLWCASAPQCYCSGPDRVRTL